MFNRIYAIINTNTVKIGLRYINFGPKKDKTASTDSRPVDVALPEFLESVPEHLVLVAAALGVAVDDGLCLFAGELHNLSVAGYVGYLQVEGYAALLGTLEVAGASQFEVGFGYAEPVVGLAHDVDALARLFA